MSATGHNARRREAAADQLAAMPAAVLARHGLPTDRDALSRMVDAPAWAQQLAGEQAPAEQPAEPQRYTRAGLEAKGADEVKALAEQVTGQKYPRKADAISALLEA